MQYNNYKDVLLKAQKEAGTFLSQLIGKEKGAGDTGKIYSYIK